MKLSCVKCNNILTKDLYLTKHFAITKSLDEWGEQEIGLSISLGSFRNLPVPFVFYARRSKALLINRLDAIGCKFLTFKEGQGCCDNSDQLVSCSQCSSIVGYENYDCWQTLHHVEIIDKSIYRVY